MLFSPATTHYRLEGLSGHVEITILPQRQVIMLPFSLIWLVGWAFGEIAVGGMLLAPLWRHLPLPGPLHRADPLPLSMELFLLVWFVLWTVGGGYVIYGVLWQLFGRERVLLDYTQLHLRQEILGRGRTRTYTLAQIRNLRVEPPPRDRGNNMIPRGTLCFDYDQRTVCFGRGLDPEEAERLLDDMVSRSPTLSSQRWG